MSQEIQFDWVSGKTAYALLRNGVGQIWNGAAFENYAAGNYANYPITATEQGAGGYFTATMPVVAAGLYSVLGKNQGGGSPGEGDITVSTGDLFWTGTVVGVSVASIVAVAQNALADAILSRDVANAEGTAAVHSLLSAVLKLVSKFDVAVAGSAVTYRTNGTTVHMTQSKVTSAALVPIQSLGVGA